MTISTTILIDKVHSISLFLFKIPYIIIKYYFVYSIMLYGVASAETHSWDGERAATP
jgi:hypothetical protein